MRFRLVVALLALAGLGQAPAGLAQSLGDAAQKEKKKRETKPSAPAAKVITQEDLEAARPPGAKDTEAKPAPAGRGTFEVPRPAIEPSGPKKSDEPESVTVFGAGQGPSSPRSSGSPSRGVAEESAQRAAQEQEWRRRGAAARAAVAAAEREVRDADQSGGQAVSQFGGDQGQADARARSAARLASARSRLEAAKRNLERLEETARREGIPPGWLR